MDNSNGDWYAQELTGLPEGWRREVGEIASAFFSDSLGRPAGTEEERHAEAARYADMIAGAVLGGTDG